MTQSSDEAYHRINMQIQLNFLQKFLTKTPDDHCCHPYPTEVVDTTLNIRLKVKRNKAFTTAEQVSDVNAGLSQTIIIKFVVSRR